MSTRKSSRATLRSLNRLPAKAQRATKRFVSGLLRALLALGRQRSLSRAGFVLPTTVLLVLVVLLTVGSIAYRTYTRTTQAISERQQRVVYNAATPAIDRAKAKLEFLFDETKDPRLPGGVPGENYLMGMLLNRTATGTPVGLDGGGILQVPPHPLGNVATNTDPYTFSGETRVNVGPSFPGDTGLDNAWRYEADTDGDGTNDATVVYSLAIRTDTANLSDTSNARTAARAGELKVRNGPLSNANQTDPACTVSGGGAASPQEGWIPDGANTAILRKNFQVDVYVMPYTANRPITTIEFQQDRRVDRGNKWGAWFRYDLEIFPGPLFNWNGAMHTEGNLISGGGNGSFVSYLISSPGSCLYTDEGTESEISVTSIPNPPFIGQFIGGAMNTDTFRNEQSVFHVPGANPITGANGDTQFNQTNDSIAPAGGNTPTTYALDPVALQTQGISISRGFNPATDAAAQAARDPNWEARVLVTQGRLRTQQEDIPYVDDSYRADNRWGPKPQYNADNVVPAAGIGTPIPAANAQLVDLAPPTGGDTSSVGLDGYWERRARIEGLRLIVGQRLEMGDPAGWGGPIAATDDDGLLREPLRPWNSCTETYGAVTLNTNNNTRCNQMRQRRTLLDNLAAVQATAVYHSATGIDLPTACLATTVHPGTPGTLERSATFQNLAYGFGPTAFTAGSNFGTATRPVLFDFFRGRGTNGWEFAFGPWATNGDYNSSTSNIRRALANLANLAGDPQGGAPSFPPVQAANSQVHPYPSMAMYGDFSMLRRVLQLLGSGTTYAQLSPADRTTLHTSSCMLGMLAYNLTYLNNFSIPGVDATLRTNLQTAIRALRSDNTSLGAIFFPDIENELGQQPQNRRRRAFPNGANTTSATIDTDYFSSPIGAYDSGTFSPSQPEIYVRLLQRLRDQPNPQINGANVSVDDLNKLIVLAQMIITKQQVARDRLYGFRGAGETASDAVAIMSNNVSTAFDCPRWRAANNPLYALCSARPRYPVLYNLFPYANHGETFYSAAPPAISTATPLANGLSRDDIDAADVYLSASNAGITYQTVPPGTILLTPRQNLASFVTPRASVNAAAPITALPISNQENLIKICLQTLCSRDSNGTASGGTGQMARLAFKDAAFYNGREAMSVRSLDIDLRMLRNNLVAGGGGDYWLPRSGIIYAFREDALSELSIVRPSGDTWANCGNEEDLRTNAACSMQTGAVSAFASVDPPLNSANRISPKPVDYYADPDRRPNGFRLRQGRFLGRNGDNGRGLSFITDNPAYIQGDFNIHENAGGNLLEEFTTALQDDWGNFYTRARANLNTNFARPTTDRWRPSEVLADGVHIISANFCDGSIEDGLTVYNTNLRSNLVPQPTWNLYGCNTTASGNDALVTSYLAMNTETSTVAPASIAGTAVDRWARANLADSVLYAEGSAQPFDLGDSPILISPNGNPIRARIFTPRQFTTPRPLVASPSSLYLYNQGYATLTTARNLNLGRANTRVNSIIISGIVPSRANQTYGGLHNFPRFLERWKAGQPDAAANVPLYISGSLLQLSFSQQATGPFEHDAWEAGANPQSGEQQAYYTPPLRRWGYDVGLQYAPAGPIAQRFVTRRRIRSEFYNEPPANDPYIVNLCEAIINDPPAQGYGGRTCPTPNT
ncbi:hormogonium polysaccharide biosynthesis protein HpsA [Leptolyngbya sp. AN02str]|uniref:hormogonium polysaccharide biosynthesis protein HpsA n=1 Tax=Leptolyngbya sp. AN02str TaxID=3423363 RepID=UPI003D30F71E